MSRNPSTLRRKLSQNLVALGLVAVLLLAGVNYLVVRSLLSESVETQLTGLRDERSQAVERSIQALQARVSTIARDPGVVEALLALSDGYEATDEDLSEPQVAELEALYDAEVLELYEQADVDHPAAAELVPQSVSGRNIQYNYIAQNPFPADERQNLDDAGDGSDYSEAHAEHHPFLRSIASTMRTSDLVLIAAESRDVVYSTSKRIDLGTNVRTGPYVDTGLGRAIAELPRAATGETVLVDSTFYLPGVAAPTIFLAAAVRTDSQVIGAIVFELPVEAVTDLTTASQQWDLLGLQNTGETYLVGPDLNLRSGSRLWFEDPDEYLRRFEAQGYDPKLSDLIQLTGSPVLLQPVDNEAVQAGLDGDQFVGTVTSYLGIETLTAAGPVDIAGLKWVVVAEQATQETTDALNTYVRSILLLLLILVPAIAIVGLGLARALVRPIIPLVAAAEEIANNDLDPDIPDLGRNELGDLGRQLENVAARLRQQEATLDDEEERIVAMLAAVLPARLIERVRRGELNIADIAETATIVSLTLTGLPDPSGSDQDATIEATSRVTSDLDELAARHGLERVQISSDQQLFLAGLGSPTAEPEQAVAFAVEVADAVSHIGQDLGLNMRTQIGLAAGEVATGVLGSSQLSFGVWGNPPGIASSLAAIADPGQVLADHSVADVLEGAWQITPVENMGLTDESIEAFAIASVTKQI